MASPDDRVRHLADEFASAECNLSARPLLFLRLPLCGALCGPWAGFRICDCRTTAQSYVDKQQQRNS